LGIFKIGSQKLFARAGFELAVILLVTASQIARITGMSHQHPTKNQLLIILKL
jgi:hypothetical protein